MIADPIHDKIREIWTELEMRIWLDTDLAADQAHTSLDAYLKGQYEQEQKTQQQPPAPEPLQTPSVTAEAPPANPEPDGESPPTSSSA